MLTNLPLSDLPASTIDKASIEDHSTVSIQPGLRPIHRLRVHFSTALRLGLANVVRAVVYRICKRAGIYRWLLPNRTAVSLNFDADSSPEIVQEPVPWADQSVLVEADELLSGKARYFSVHAHEVGNPPDWFFNPFQNKRHPQPTQHWSKIPDFSVDGGDIKVVWELSRFAWAPVLARAFRISGDSRYLSALRLWMQDWWRRNPPNTGPNWMCAQETSIRLINALTALRLIGQGKNTGLTAFVDEHCRRIDATTLYAVAQDNNHATSEAAGLFVGGAWMATHGAGDAKSRGRRWAQKGRKLLHRGVRRLVSPDGSFSQHSLTYHRMLLDTLSVAEVWRRHLSEVPLAEDFYARAAAATRWLGAMIDPSSGDGPNLGANDGAHPYRFDGSTYRDFRPCLQLASRLFMSNPALEQGPWDESSVWLGVPALVAGEPWLRDLRSAVFLDGGYAIIRNTTGARVLLRAPTARFRPAHGDALHLDLWWKGKNVLRDGGTFAYANGGVVAEELASVIGHNTPQFDDHDQMPKLGRFLYGDWMKVTGDLQISTTPDGQSWAGRCTDFWGPQHRRTVTLNTNKLSVVDQMQGFTRKAVLRWRLAPGDWSLSKTGCISSIAQVRVESSVPIRSMSLKSTWESRHYLEKSTIPVLQVELDKSPAILATTVTLT